MKFVKLNMDVKCHIRRWAQEWWGAKCYGNGQGKELSVIFFFHQNHFLGFCLCEMPGSNSNR